jgi:hypothetical protein
VSYGSPLNEVVLFEIPGFDEATQLSARLAEDWFSWVQTHDRLRLVAVMLRAEDGDLALVLRSVQRWGAESGRGLIPFELDGRRYALDTGAPLTVAA